MQESPSSSQILWRWIRLFIFKSKPSDHVQSLGTVEDSQILKHLFGSLDVSA